MLASPRSRPFDIFIASITSFIVAWNFETRSALAMRGLGCKLRKVRMRRLGGGSRLWANRLPIQVLLYGPLLSSRRVRASSIVRLIRVRSRSMGPSAIGSRG